MFRQPCHLYSKRQVYHFSWWYQTLVTDLICQWSCDVIARLSVESWGLNTYGLHSAGRSYSIFLNQWYSNLGEVMETLATPATHHIQNLNYLFIQKLVYYINLPENVMSLLITMKNKPWKGAIMIYSFFSTSRKQNGWSA